MSRGSLVVLTSFVFLLAACGPDTSEPPGTIFINARVIDGSGGPSRDVNVRVVGERITAVGEIEPLAVDTVVDANGLVLAPGFIDTHSHHEDGLFEMPGALATVNQGITFILWPSFSPTSRRRLLPSTLHLMPAMGRYGAV